MIAPDLAAHLAGGLTTLCHAWAVTRTDGALFGFTDHDRDLAFDGITFRADSGLSARALQQGTGLSVDNTEALGLLSDAGLSEVDIVAGRFDGAEVRCWRVNWADPDQRLMQFRGTIGELQRNGASFTAELRGLTEALNRPLGRIYQKPCTAVLGDTACRVDLSGPDHSLTLTVAAIESTRVLRLAGAGTAPQGWFRRGRLMVLDGAAAGLHGTIKRDTAQSSQREVELWEPLRAPLAPGDSLRLLAGCDKRFATCRDKFANLVNFQGFPDLPGDDWRIIDPAQSGSLRGGSRR
ncbi:MAG: DUF2163 domain-containing protein [Rhodobacterales bacterium]|nr:DUF2163 domain-containing protein [Rhodobacterales bacterium]MDX5381786.1 DUF2163 domain-containing protein [Rhodobacterales bacterium]MDX5488815.1 DUF2163 domain-containing protein [Rhodobacterales bacterium]